MKFRSTVILGIIFVALAGYVYFVEIRGTQRKEVTERESKRALSFEKPGVNALKLTFSDRTIHCIRDSTERWHLVRPIETEGSTEDINRMLGSLEDATIQRTVADSVETLSDYGLDQPRVIVSIRQRGEEGWKSLLLGDENPTGSYVYAKGADEPGVFLVSSGLFGSLDKQLNELRFKKVLDFDKNDVSTISLSTSGGSIVCSKVLDEWRLEKPIQARADGDKIDTMLRKLSEAEVERFIDEDSEDERQYDLDHPEITLRLFLGEAKGTKTLHIGERTDEAYYARDASRLSTFTVDSSLVSALQKDVVDVRDKSVLAIKPYTVQRVHVRIPEMDLLCSKDTTGTWYILEPIRARADESKMNDLLWDVEGLKAEAFVSDAPEALTPYGLSEPRARFELWTEEGTMQVLFVGVEKGEQVYVKNSTAPSVYLVDADFLEEMGKDITEFRDKKVLLFYSYQVNEIDITGGGETSTWKKDSKGNWKGPLGVSVERSDVSGFLSDLQRLEVEEFVDDRPSDVTQYGLSEPQYTVTLKFEEVPSQVLFVGREQNEMVYVKNRDIDAVYAVKSVLMDTIRHLLTEEEEEA